MFDMLGATFGATLAGCLALAGATGAAVYFFMKRKLDEQKQIEEQRTVSFQQMQTIVTNEIKNVYELVTVRENFTADISFADDKKIFGKHIPFSDRKFQMSYSGTITCGCDLEAIRFERDALNNRVRIIVPMSRILDMYADVSSFKVHQRSKDFFADEIQLEQQKEMVTADLEAHRQHALQSGICEQANENVRRKLTSIIVSRGLNRSFDFEIIFRGGTRALNSSRQNLLR
ncbi:MAG: DUF4230 domain-containing protein [Selenomonadaceae bacterium]|nr:DUF4230 domain-containing protein [Selenomonadaceae bacterium]MBQ9496391.1 DUF4230 domain-containing protein [Selenomonadaceae bacterium]